MVEEAPAHGGLLAGRRVGDDPVWIPGRDLLAADGAVRPDALLGRHVHRPQLGENVVEERARAEGTGEGDVDEHARPRRPGGPARHRRRDAVPKLPDDPLGRPFLAGEAAHGLQALGDLREVLEHRQQAEGRDARAACQRHVVCAGRVRRDQQVGAAPQEGLGLAGHRDVHLVHHVRDVAVAPVVGDGADRGDARRRRHREQEVVADQRLRRNARRRPRQPERVAGMVAHRAREPRRRGRGLSGEGPAGAHVGAQEPAGQQQGEAQGDLEHGPQPPARQS